RVRARGREAFDGDDAVARLEAADRDRAGALDLAVDMHRAGAALRDAAAVLGAGETGLLADRPKQRRVGLHLKITHLAVDVQLRHGRPPLSRRRKSHAHSALTPASLTPSVTLRSLCGSSRRTALACRRQARPRRFCNWTVRRPARHTAVRGTPLPPRRVR